jgi:hypothetical protein
MDNKELEKWLKDNVEGTPEDLQPEWLKLENAGDCVIGKFIGKEKQSFNDERSRNVYTLQLQPDDKNPKGRKVRVPGSTVLDQIMETVEIGTYVAIIYTGEENLKGAKRLSHWQVKAFTPKKAW